MKKRTVMIMALLMLVLVLMDNSILAQDTSFDYGTNASIEENISGKYVDGELYMLGDYKYNGRNTKGILTCEERTYIGLNRRYICKDGYLYDQLVWLSGTQTDLYHSSLTIEDGKCGTLQGFFNTGRYDCWDTEPVEGALTFEDMKAGNYILGDNYTAIPISKAEKITVTDVSKTMYAVKKCNVRENGSTDYNIIGSLKFNEEVTVTGVCSTGWYRIDYKGKAGYVSDTMLTDTKYVEPEPEPEPEPEKPVIVNRLFEDLNEEALGVLKALLEDSESEVKIEVLDTAEHKIIPKEILSIMKAVEKGVKIHFVDTNGVISYSYTLNGVNDEKDLNLAVTVEETGLNFEAEEVLNYTLSMQIKLPRADGEYFIYIGNTENNVLHDKVKTDENGYITFVTNMQTDYMLTEKEFVKEEPEEEPEPEMPEEITPPVENEEEPDEDGVIITPPTEDIPEAEPDNNDTGNEAEQAESEETVLEKDETNDRMKWYILLGSVSLVVIVIVGFAISKRNKKKKNELSKVKDNE